MNISQELYKKKTAAATSTPRPPIRTLEIPSSARKKETISPSDSPCDTRQVKGSPATLAKLMKKHKKMEKHVEKLKKQLNKTKEEEVEIQRIINALVALHCEDETGSYSSFDEFSVDDCTTARGISEVFNEAIFFLG